MLLHFVRITGLFQFKPGEVLPFLCQEGTPPKGDSAGTKYTGEKCTHLELRKPLKFLRFFDLTLQGEYIYTTPSHIPEIGS